MLEVTAAVIYDGERFLVCQRPEGKSQALLWEFPGGKIEPGETGEECIAREIREELGVQIRVTGELGSITNQYPEKTVHLHFYRAAIAGGELQQKEHAALAWITPEETGAYRFCPADRKMLELTDNFRKCL